jgi:hypothetical protein
MLARGINGDTRNPEVVNPVQALENVKVRLSPPLAPLAFRIMLKKCRDLTSPSF